MTVLIRRPAAVPVVAFLAILLLLFVTPAAAVAQQATPPEAADAPVDLFGFEFNQSERFKIGGELMVGWGHDGAQAALGLEKQGRVGWAILSVSGRVSNHVRYYVSVNPVSGSIRHMFFDKKTGAMWFGTDANNLGRIDTGSVER